MTINEVISSPNTSSRGSNKPQMIVCHIADGTYEGTKAWVLNPVSQISCNFLISKEGKICQCVAVDKAAWCNGTSSDPAANSYYGNSTLQLVQTLKGNANLYSVSIEIEGYYNQTQGELGAAQLDALVWLIGYIRDEVLRIYGHTIPLDREHIVGHYQINPITRTNCPGQKFPWAELMEQLGKGNRTGHLYRVQVGAFASYENAVTFRDRQVAPKGLEAYVTSQGTDGLYRVQLGAFSVKENAERYLTQVREMGLDAFLKEEGQ